MSRNAFLKIEREQAQATALREHNAMERKHDVVPVPASDLAELRRDAERYRAIRAGDLYLGPRAVLFNFKDGRWNSCRGIELDKAADELMRRDLLP
jgi:hypothetical protein